MMRELAVTAVIVVLAAGTALADMRGQTVCGIPPTERITITMPDAQSNPNGDQHGRWYACGWHECPAFSSAAETNALSFATNGESNHTLACEVTAAISSQTGRGKANLYRTGQPMLSTDNFDPRIAIAGGGGTTDPPGPTTPIGGGTGVVTTLENGRGQSWYFRRTGTAPDGTVDLDVRGYFANSEVMVSVSLVCQDKDDEDQWWVIARSTNGGNFVWLQLSTPEPTCVIAASSAGGDTEFHLVVAETVLLELSTDMPATIRQAGLSALDDARQQSRSALRRLFDLRR